MSRFGPLATGYIPTAEVAFGGTAEVRSHVPEVGGDAFDPKRYFATINFRIAKGSLVLAIRAVEIDLTVRLNSLVPKEGKSRARLNATILCSMAPQSRLKRCRLFVAEETHGKHEEKPCPPPIKRMRTVLAAALSPFGMRTMSIILTTVI